MKPEDRTYYANRAVAERQMAATSSNEQVAKIHREIAEKYEAQVAQEIDRVRLLIADDAAKFPFKGRSE